MKKDSGLSRRNFAITYLLRACPAAAGAWTGAALFFDLAALGTAPAAKMSAADTRLRTTWSLGRQCKLKKLGTRDEELIAAYILPSSGRAAGETAWEVEEAWGCAPCWTGDLERLDLHPFCTEALRGALDGRTEAPDPKAEAGDAGRLSTSWAGDADLLATGHLLAPLELQN